MSADPGGDIRATIAAAGLGWTAGTNLFDGPEHPLGTGVPNKAVFVVPYGGSVPSPFLGGSTEERFPAVQVLVRSDPDDYDGGESDARNIRDALHHQTISRGIGGSYTDCRTIQSAPLYLGVDEERRHRWTINVELWHRE